MTGPAVGCNIFLQVADGVDGVRETEFRILHAQRVRAQGDDIRQAKLAESNERCLGKVIGTSAMLA